MNVVFDNNTLCLLLHPEADVPNDPQTGKPITRAQDRMGLLVEQLRETGARILIPAPVLSEFLTYATSEYLAEINKSAYFEVASFDQRAAVEAAAALRRNLKSGRGKKLGMTADWQKVKVDRQVVAIAVVNNAETIYSTDADILTLADDSGLQGIHVAMLPLPASATPLLDAVEEADPNDPAIPSTLPSPPVPQSRGDEPVSAVPPAPSLPSGHHAGPEPQ